MVDRYEPLLGTTVEIRIQLSGADRHDEADGLSESMAAEMLRLQTVLSSVDPTSEFRRWTRGEVAAPSDDLAEVLRLAAHWQLRSQGRFSPAVGALSEVWVRAERSGRRPDPEELAAVVAAISEPRWSADEGGIEMLGDASVCTLNALAKGWIADRAARLARGSGVDGIDLVAVNAGGDIAHVGPVSLIVGIEDPFRPVDNLPPFAQIELRDCGLATSGSSRRGFDVGGRRHSHVIDPRSGHPVDHIAAISVIAADCATADVLCTTLGMLQPLEAIAEADALDAGCLVIDADGRHLSNVGWSRLATGN